MITTHSIPSFSNYGVTESGEVFSFRKGKFKKCNPFRDRDGYIRFMLYRDDGLRKTMASHRVVYSALVGELVEGMTIDHLDGDKTNNSYKNLEQVTSLENTKRQHLDRPIFSKGRKLSLDQAKEARQLRAIGHSYQKIADRYMVHWSTIHAIVNKNHYKEAP